MGGLAMLILIGLYFGLATIAIVKVKPDWAKGLALLATLLIPTTDAVYGRIKLQGMCKAEGGLKVYRVINGVEGFMDNSTRDYWIKNHGYQFTESSPVNGKVTRYSKKDGQIIKEDPVSPKSQYQIRHKIYGEKEPFRHDQYLIVNIVTSEILATDTQIGFNGGWVERFIATISDGGINPIWCTTQGVEPVLWNKRIVLNTLTH